MDATESLLRRPSFGTAGSRAISRELLHVPHTTAAIMAPSLTRACRVCGLPALQVTVPVSHRRCYSRRNTFASG
jgi:hypothetical protein